MWRKAGTRRAPLTAAALALAALALAISLPAGASAATQTLKGELDGGGTVAFELKRKPSGSRRVVRWRWRDFPILCKNGPQILNGEFLPPWITVTGRAFRVRADAQKPLQGFAEVDGSFPKKDWRHAAGTLEVMGDTSVGTVCDSGIVKWSAKQV